MKTTRLNRLLMKATLLPWRSNFHKETKTTHIFTEACNGDVDTVFEIRQTIPMFRAEERANISYMIHAANTLPELIGALQELRAAQRDQKWTQKHYTAGTCNAEDAHNESFRRIELAELTLDDALKRAETPE